jgi:hypothetical protein
MSEIATLLWLMYTNILIHTSQFVNSDTLRISVNREIFTLLLTNVIVANNVLYKIYICSVFYNIQILRLVLKCP